MKTILKFVALGLLATGFSGLFTPSDASAQVVVTGYAPAVTYYRPRPILRPFTYAPAVTAVPTTAYYAPTTAYYAPTTSYYAPSVTSYYAPSAVSAPVTTYYAPSVAAPVTTYYAPSAYVAPVVPVW